MSRLERTYTLFGGMIVSILCAGAAFQDGAEKMATAFVAVMAFLFAAILVENSNVS